MNAQVEDNASQEPAKATSVETVTLTDGRAVDFAGKRKMIKRSWVADDGSLHVGLDFRNGETRDFVLNPDLVNNFALHGAEQKYGDETAGTTDVDDMVLEVDELHDRLTKGEWSVKRESSGMAGTSVLLKALVEYSGKTVEQIKEFLKPKSAAEKTALRNSVQLKPIVERIEAEKAAKGAKVDTDALLASI